MDWNELILTALRATFVYFYLLLLVRILGKREIGASSAFDLLVALMLGDVVDEVIYGDVTLAQGALAMTIIAAWHLINAFRQFTERYRRKKYRAPQRPCLVRTGASAQRTGP